MGNVPASRYKQFSTELTYHEFKRFFGLRMLSEGGDAYLRTMFSGGCIDFMEDVAALSPLLKGSVRQRLRNTFYEFAFLQAVWAINGIEQEMSAEDFTDTVYNETDINVPFILPSKFDYLLLIPLTCACQSIWDVIQACNLIHDR
uniref:Uncharacterized protein n=1 Tax=Denticeps clupeoides TaxID=299321 RepID=A0AAY4CAT5_9TELE